MAQAQTQEFHKGDHVLVTPYGGAWAECTLTSDRLGYAHNYSYFAVCAPMSAGATPDNRSHQYSEERVKSVNDPAAQAGLAQMRALFPPYRGPNAAPLAQAPNAAPPAPQAAAPQQQPQPVARRFEQPTAPQASTQAGPGGAFKSPDQCTAGTRVTDKSNKSGTVIGIEGHMNGCRVRLDDGTETFYLFWMLHYAGTSSETNDKLVPGIYKCYAAGNYTFMDLSITSPNTYTSAGESGRYHVTPTRDIVFESGSLTKYRAHLLDGPSIGLNSNGDSFYGTTCDLDKK
jgi:hypothetical protein